MRKTLASVAFGLAAALLIGGSSAGEEPSARLLTASKLQAAGDHQAAIELLEQIRELDPDNQQVLYGLAVSHYAVGNYREAARIGSTLLAEHPDSPAELHAIVGSSYGRLGDWEKSEATLNAGLSVWPDDQTLTMQHAISIEALGRFDEAIAELEICLKRSPYDATLWRAFGDALSLTGAPGRAFAAYVRSLTLEDDNVEAHEVATSLWTVLFNGASGASHSDAAEKAEAKGLALVAALRADPTWKGQSDARFFAYALDTSLQLVSALHGSKDPNVFWGPFVLDYFNEVRAAGLMETLAYEVRRSTGDPDVARWLSQHNDKVTAFRDWSERWSVHRATVDERAHPGS